MPLWCREWGFPQDRSSHRTAPVSGLPGILSLTGAQIRFPSCLQIFCRVWFTFLTEGLMGAQEGALPAPGKAPWSFFFPWKAGAWLRQSPKNPPPAPRQGCDPVARSHAVGVSSVTVTQGRSLDPPWPPRLRTEPKGGEGHGAKGVGWRRRFSAVFSSQLCCLLVRD